MILKYRAWRLLCYDIDPKTHQPVSNYVSFSLRLTPGKPHLSVFKGSWNCSWRFREGSIQFCPAVTVLTTHYVGKLSALDGFNLVVMGAGPVLWAFTNTDLLKRS